MAVGASDTVVLGAEEFGEGGSGREGVGVVRGFIVDYNEVLEHLGILREVAAVEGEGRIDEMAELGRWWCWRCWRSVFVDFVDAGAGVRGGAGACNFAVDLVEGFEAGVVGFKDGGRHLGELDILTPRGVILAFVL